MYIGLPSIQFSTTSHSHISYELEVTFPSAIVLVFDTKPEAIGLNFPGGLERSGVAKVGACPPWALTHT